MGATIRKTKTVSPNIPCTEHGVKDATTDNDILNSFFCVSDNPQPNIAIATGIPSGVIVIDVDTLADGKKLETANEPLLTTWLAETGSGGLHYYFRYDERCDNVKNRTKIAGDIDIRSTGGAAIAPPSRHANGNRYRWLVSPDDCELATVPDWLLNIMLGTQSLTLVPERATTLSERMRLYLREVLTCGKR